MTGKAKNQSIKIKCPLIFSLILILALRPFKADTPPVIDGTLEDPAWQKAPYVKGFKTWHPDYGQDMADDTFVYYAYDRENLYFALRCFDRQPDKIKASVSNRDRSYPLR